MHNVLAQFQQNILRVRSLGDNYIAFEKLTTSALDFSDLLRTQIVMSVSAIDHYIHEIVLTGMKEIYSGSRTETPLFNKFQVPIQQAMTGLTSGSIDWFENIVREKHSFLAFQHPEKIANAIRLFSSSELWNEVGQSMGISPSDVKRRLILIVDRRNKIAHEADLDPSYPGVRWPITEIDTTEVVNFCERLCSCIHSVVA